MASTGVGAKRAWKLHEFVAHGSNVNCVALGQMSGRVLVTGGEDKKVNLWAVGKPNCIMSLSGHTTPVECVRFGNAEELVCAGSMSGALKIWDLEAAKIVRTLTGHKSGIRTVDFHPYGNFVASGSLDTNIKLWDMRRKGCIFTYKGHANTVNSVRFSPDGRWIASAGEDGTVKLWDLAQGRMLTEFVNHTGPVCDVRYHPNEFLLASGSADRTVKFWDLESLQQVSTSEGDSSPIRCIFFDPDGDCLYVGAQDLLKVYGWEPSRTLDTLLMGWGKVADLAVSGQQIIGTTFLHASVSIYTVDLTRVQPHGGQINTNVNTMPHYPCSQRKIFNKDRQQQLKPKMSVSNGTNNINRLCGGRIPGEEDSDTNETAIDSGPDENTVCPPAEIQSYEDYHAIFQPRNVAKYQTVHRQLLRNDEGSHRLTQQPECRQLAEMCNPFGAMPGDLAVNRGVAPSLMRHCNTSMDYHSPSVTVKNTYYNNGRLVTNSAVSNPVSPQSHHNNHLKFTNAAALFSSEIAQPPLPLPLHSPPTKPSDNAPPFRSPIKLSTDKPSMVVPPYGTTDDILGKAIEQLASTTPAPVLKALNCPQPPPNSQTQSRAEHRTQPNRVETNRTESSRIEAIKKNNTVYYNNQKNDHRNANVEHRNANIENRTANFAHQDNRKPLHQQQVKATGVAVCDQKVGSERGREKEVDIVPLQLDRPAGLEVDDFLPCNARRFGESPGGYDRLSELSEAEAISSIMSGHDSMRAVLHSRQRNLQIVFSLWAGKDPKVAVDAAIGMNDATIVVDLLGVITLRPLIWTLDMCVILLPAIFDLIQSRYEAYMTVGCDALRLILRNFASVIKTNLAANPGIGTDVAREERYNKCKSCFDQLVSIRAFVLKRQTLQGKLGHTFRELHILMQSLEAS